MPQPIPTASQQIRTLLIVLGIGVFSAFAFTAFLLHFYGPSGSYALKDVLLEPSLLKELSYKDQNPRTGSPARFVFDSVEYSYWIASSREWRRVSVSLDQYEVLYNQLVKDKSEEEVSMDTITSFAQLLPSSLIITVKTLSDKESQVGSKVFQEIQFSKDNYRVELRGQTTSMGSWVYFYHPEIQSISLRLLKEK